MARKRLFNALYLLICVIIQGHVSKGKDLHVSRASGDDSWSCDKKKPCKTIWRAVTLASRGDHIYLDGTNTEKDPYTCQSGTLRQQGIYINTSLSFIGFGPRPPHIRCPEGTSLTFKGSGTAQETKINLSRLFLNKSLVNFKDSSVNIGSCKFEDSEHGVQFLISTRVVSNIQITNSTFVGNKECISVIVDSTKNSNLSHQSSHVIFKLQNSSFYGNTISDKGSCLSFSELPDNNRSVSCNITLGNVTFSQNKFSSRGLVFVELENGNQISINLEEVIFANNSPSSDQEVLTGGHSEFFVRSTIVNTFVNASNFTGQNARSFDVSAANVSLQIYNSSFGGHKVKGNGGVIFLRGTDLCKVNITNSSFVNTSAAQGGAFDIECMAITFSLQGSIFSRNTVTYGSGGAISINAHMANVSLFNSSSTNSNVSSSEQGGATLNVTSVSRTKKLLDGVLLLIVEGCSFIGCRSGEGGTLFAAYNNHLQMSIKDSHFISNSGFYGAAIFVRFIGITDCLKRNMCNMISQVTIENSTFSKNEAAFGGALWLAGNYNHSMITLVKVILDFNIALTGGAAYMAAFSIIILKSRIYNNNADVGSGATLENVKNLEVLDSIFEGNSYWSHDTSQRLGGGAILFILREPHFTSDHSVLIVNTTFNNCSTQHGGAINFDIETDERLHLRIKNSRFTKNFAAKNGGAISFSLAQDIQGDLECIKPDRKLNMENIDVMEREPSWDYKSHLIFEDTTFDANVAEVGGATYITNGNVTFTNCHFVNNFASAFGCDIYTVESSTSLKIQHSRFRQTKKFFNLSTPSSLNPSFINIESEGPVVLQNTTLDSWPYSDKVTLFLVSNSRLSFTGKNNLTRFYCPLGSNLTITNLTTTNTKKINKTCKVKIITRYTRFDCVACTGNAYSLQHGHAIDGQAVPGFQCLPCPFGANCTKNILAKRNFWGFEEQSSPPTLRFTMCPVGYCIPPPETFNFSEYNGCQGNRSGELCGNCSENYTETLYSTHCRPLNQCNDYWFWPVALTYVSLMALYFTFKPPVVPWIKSQILWFKENTPEDQDNNFDKGYLKILFYFYQASNLLLVSKYLQYTNERNLIEPIVAALNFKVHSSRLNCPFRGLTLVTKQLFSASHVFCILLMICAFYILHLGIQKLRSQGVPSAGPYIGGILQTLLLGYTALATVSFNLLRCVPIGSERRLLYDGNIVCFQWWQYIFIAFVCTFVVPFVFVLLWSTFKLYGGTLSVEKFLLACFFPFPSLIYWLFVWLSRVIGYSVNGHSSSCQITKDSVERVLYDSFKRPVDGNKLSLSWESIMIGRRLILVMIKTFVSDPFLRLLVMNLFCVFFFFTTFWLSHFVIGLLI